MARTRGDPYAPFSRYYDFLYHGIVDYRGDVAFLEAIFRRFCSQRPQTILDLGCGTGNHAGLLAQKGYRVTGLDSSAPQLAVARRKARASALRIRFVRANMRSYELGETFDAAICMFGAFGYLHSDDDLRASLASLQRHMNPGGLFIFEVWQKSGVIPGLQSWVRKKGPKCELVRLSQNRFDASTGTLTIEFQHFVLRGRRVLDRFDARHVVRTHTVAGVRRLLRTAGLKPLAFYAGTNVKKGFRPVARNAFRVMAIARSMERSRAQS